MSVKKRDQIIGEYFADLILEDKLICELKTVDVLKKAHEELPLTLSSRKYSGKFVLRSARSTSPPCYGGTDVEGVSLNRIASEKLA